ncbi:hypothetical protein SteCoe_12984 [Stentor coeruleus]|uniref:Protein kinase domain-containing protein n=1 Tax=Stentor coeruleus TaxID=5963 RepID=A0A1R2C9E4_9CILI|nr:hypothetical protein SteCoe_12984 [Stentor coeruleus]
MGDDDGNAISSLGASLLFVLYAITLAFCLFRTVRLHKFSPDWKPSKAFYISVLLQSFLRALCFLLLLVLGKKSLNRTSVFLLLSIPDSMFIVSYLLLIWQVLLVFNSAHTNTSITLAIFSKLFKMARHDKFENYITFFLTIWIGTQTSLYILVVNSVINFKNISREVGICNFSLAACTIIGLIVLQIRYSGVPVRTASWKAKINRICIVILFWTLARILQGILDILDSNKDTSLTYQMSHTDDDTLGHATAAYLYSALVISEIVCILMVLDYAFMGIFVFTEEERDKNKEDKPRELLMISYESSNSLGIMPLQLRLNKEEINFGLQIDTIKSVLGKVYKATYMNKNVFVRKITFSRLSTYVLEDFSEELDAHRVEHANILPIIGVVLELPVIYTITPLIEPGSLFKMLHLERKCITLQTKISYAKQIANALLHVHVTNRVHGHFTSENVLIKSNNHAYLSDLGLVKIKKYASIVCGYTTKSAWSSPQILRDKRLTPIHVEPSDDIYSFGVFLWELFTEQIPFIGYGLGELHEKVGIKGCRPVITKTIPSEITEIILGCWEEMPDDRTSMDIVLSKLNEV